jgi:hypothetical protein
MRKILNSKQLKPTAGQRHAGMQATLSAVSGSSLHLTTLDQLRESAGSPEKPFFLN